MLLLALMAVVVGSGGAFAAWLLLKLIALATNLFWFHRLSVMAALAAVAGLTDFMGDERVRRLGDADKHMIANVSVVVLEIVNLVLRLKNDDAVGGIGVWLSLVAVLLLLYSGWMGGQLVFVHRVGVRDRTKLM
jgi:uncharacterized membrane protein